MANPKIMVVDDDPDFLKTMEMDLNKKGYDAVFALNGKEGCEKVKQERPDLILIDIKMPKMDGYTFVRRLKRDEDTRTIPLIILTSYEPMKEMFALEGVEDYFVKNADTTELFKVIDKKLGRA